MENINDSKNIWDRVQTIAGALLYVISAAMIAFAVYLCFSPDVWYDELFSIQLSEKSIPEMVRLTAADVHPPLYYIIVHLMGIIGSKIFGSAAGVVAGDSVRGLLAGAASGSFIIAAKIVSVIPYVIILIYGLTIIRKRYGCLIGGLFSAALIAMPQMADYTVEVRMYSWVLLFVTALVIHARPFLENDKEKQIRGLKYGKVLPIFIYGLLACYTQYYGVIAVAFVYLFLVVWSVRKNVYQLGIILISGNLTALCYVPWIGTVLSAARDVSGGYWIQPLSWRSFGGVIKYLMKPAFFNDKLASVLAVLMFVLVAGIVIANIRDAYMWLSFMPVLGIIAVGFVASAVIGPVFTYRYMMPGMGAMWLGVLVAAGKAMKDDGLETHENARSKVAAIFGLAFTVLAVVFCIRDFWAFRGNELYKRVNMVKSEEFWDSIGAGMQSEDDMADSSDVVIICNFDQVAALSLFYANGQCDIVGESGENLKIPVYLYGAMTDAFLEKMFPGIRVIDTPSQVRDLVDSGARVLFLGSFNSRGDIVKEWEDTEGITNENQGSFLLERYWFDVFELK